MTCIGISLLYVLLGEQMATCRPQSNRFDFMINHSKFCKTNLYWLRY